MILVKSPVRISFCSADYPYYTTQIGGSFIGGAINKYIYLCVRETPYYEPHFSKLIYSQTELLGKNEDIRHKAIKAVLDGMNFRRGLELAHSSDVKSKSGLGSSSSFTVALVTAIARLQNIKLSTEEALLKSRYIETEILRENVGFQDFYHAAYGGLAFYIIHKHTNEIVRCPIQLSEASLRELENHIILLKTPNDRRASEVAASYANKETNVALYKKIGDLCWKMRQAIETLEWEELGWLVKSSWELKRGLSSSVSSPEIEEICKAANLAGAFGTRLQGAGQNGTIMVVAPPHRHYQILSSLSKFNLYKIDFNFTNEGCHIVGQ